MWVGRIRSCVAYSVADSLQPDVDMPPGGHLFSGGATSKQPPRHSVWWGIRARLHAALSFAVTSAHAHCVIGWGLPRDEIKLLPAMEVRKNNLVFCT